MIGNAKEMAYLMSFEIKLLSTKGISRSEAMIIRKYVLNDGNSITRIHDFLERVGCHKIRDARLIPALICDANGDMMDEYRFYKLHVDAKFRAKMNEKIGISAWINENILSTRGLRFVLKHKHGTIIEPRYWLPSVWSFDATYIDDTDYEAAFGKMLTQYDDFE